MKAAINPSLQSVAAFARSIRAKESQVRAVLISQGVIRKSESRAATSALHLGRARRAIIERILKGNRP